MNQREKSCIEDCKETAPLSSSSKTRIEVGELSSLENLRGDICSTSAVEVCNEIAARLSSSSKTRVEEGGEHSLQGRERLTRHQMEMGGRVWVPDIWGQERLLKDWIDCASFDRSLVPTGIVSARRALVEECRRGRVDSPAGVRFSIT